MKIYEEPRIDVLSLSASDVITGSQDTGWDDSEW